MKSMRTNPIDSKNAGLRNEELILNLLRKRGPLSQAQICKLTGLGSSTASYITGRLREKNLILEKTGDSAKRGAKPIILNINPQARFITAVSLQPTTFTMALFDFNCQMLEEIHTTAQTDNSVEHLCDKIQTNLSELLSRHNIEQKALLGIGITLSGSISPDGIVKLSSPLGWKNVPLKKLLSERLNCPVSIYSTRVRFLAEIAVNDSLAAKTVLYINIADGVGGTLYSEGKIMGGASGRFGELGHVVIDPQGPICGCGQKGCLEAFISGPAISKKIKTDIAQSRETSLKNTINEPDKPEEVINKCFKAAEQNDDYAISIRNMLTERLTSAAAAAIDYYDPDILMLTGYVVKPCMNYLIDSIKQVISSGIYDSASRNITVLPAQVGKDALIKGLAMAVLQNSAPIV
ncbi:MAG: ROK family transcriptional regulator [Phycisphaerae bacterium]